MAKHGEIIKTGSSLSLHRKKQGINSLDYKGNEREPGQLAPPDTERRQYLSETEKMTEHMASGWMTVLEDTAAIRKDTSRDGGNNGTRGDITKKAKEVKSRR